MVTPQISPSKLLDNIDIVLQDHHLHSAFGSNILSLQETFKAVYNRSFSGIRIGRNFLQGTFEPPPHM